MNKNLQNKIKLIKSLNKNNSIKSKLIQNKPVKNKPVQNKPVQNKPVKNKPVQNKPVKNKPVQNKLKIVLTMCFFDNNNNNKTKITKLMMKYYLFLRNHLKDQINIKYLLVGSEKNKSKDLVLNLGFEKDEYIEYKQQNISKLDIIERKYLFAWETAMKLYPDLDILLTNGSSDFICINYFENLIKNFKYNEPQIYGINNFNNNGSVYLLNNNFDNIYQLNSIKNKFINSTTFIGGIYGFNKRLLNNLNNKLILPKGNEYKLEEYCLKNGNAVIYFNSNFFINFKIDKSDYTSFKTINKCYKPTRLDKNIIKEHIHFFSFYSFLKDLYNNL
jgi:hypothetical protein